MADTEVAKVHWVQQMTLHGLLDDQFDQLLQLQQEDSPGFLQEIITLFFTDSSSKFAKLDQLLAQQPVSFQEVDQTVHQLKGSSASLGARQVADLCIQLRLACQAMDVPTCKRLTQSAKDAVSLLQQQMEYFTKLLQ